MDRWHVFFYLPLGCQGNRHLNEWSESHWPMSSEWKWLFTTTTRCHEHEWPEFLAARVIPVRSLIVSGVIFFFSSSKKAFLSGRFERHFVHDNYYNNADLYLHRIMLNAICGHSSKRLCPANYKNKTRLRDLVIFNQMYLSTSLLMNKYIHPPI